jgi:four helix bundle protein
MSKREAPGRTEIRSHRDLRVWRLGRELARQVYALTQRFPDGERFGLALQLRRAAVSVPSNVAEGFARGSSRDYARFLTIALGSVGELETQLLIAGDLSFAPADELQSVLRTNTSVGRMLSRLRRAIVTTTARPFRDELGRPAQGPGPRAQGRARSAP